MGMSLLVKCEDCKQGFSIDSTVVKRKEYLGNKGESIWVTYYDCPECGRKHMVQIDNQETESMLSDVTRLMCEMAIKKKSGRTVSKKQSAKFKRLKDDLALSRKDLLMSYNMKKVYDKSGEETILVFSV